MITDIYKNFEELKKEKIKWIDYEIDFKENKSEIIILAIHWGYIEPWTETICKEIAWDEYYK